MVQYASLSNLQTFLDNSKNIFAAKSDLNLLKDQVDNIETGGSFMASDNPTGTGSLLMNNWPNQPVGENAVVLGQTGIASGKVATSLGYQTYAKGNYSTALGYDTDAYGDYSYAEGYKTYANGSCAHVEGGFSRADSDYSHAEGYETQATGVATHSEGHTTIAYGSFSHAEGRETFTNGDCTHAEGRGTRAVSENQHTQGRWNVEDTTGTYAHIVGNGTSNEARSNAHTLDWSGNAWFAGDVTATDGDGNEISLLAVAANAGSGDYLAQNSPVGTGSFSMNRKADTEIGSCSVTLGSNCTATGEWSYAEGYETISSSLATHAEGYQTVSSGGHSHAEGYGSVASGQFSHAQNDSTVASGQGSHSEGCGTIAASLVQHAQGAFNIEDTANTYLHIVGNGESGELRSNAHTLDWNGNAWFSGDVTSTDSNGNSISLNSLAVAIDDITPIDISDIEGLFV